MDGTTNAPPRLGAGMEKMARTTLRFRAPVRAGLVGVTGYTGMELIRLLAGHPNMRLTAATSRGEAGKRLGDMYPFLNKLKDAAPPLAEPEPAAADLRLIEPDPDAVAEACDLAFLAVPHTAATVLYTEFIASSYAFQSALSAAPSALYSSAASPRGM